MIHIETLSELRKAWAAILSAFSRDLAFSQKLALDPVTTLRDRGYDVSGEAATALKRALP
ncbi:MAG: hypothetical protein EP329_15800 [Deltaproteobacteria bacterium]|nr:MAG: hypothetical protein EP329_15800 [Deltaproteobacteria bacterium]